MNSPTESNDSLTINSAEVAIDDCTKDGGDEFYQDALRSKNESLTIL